MRPFETGRALCADLSQEAAEPLAATASHVEHWLLVEYRGLWPYELIGGSVLSPDVKAHLREQLAALPHARLLFIRRPERRRREGYELFYGVTLAEEQRFYGVEFGSYDDLLELDVARALARRDGGAELGLALDHPLFVVCTHGKRDRCCAKYGRPLYDEVRAQAEGDWAWQSTHVGGDRFAGNLVCLPEGLCFGRVARADVWPVLDEYLAGRIYLDRYRGRSCYRFPVQAAERALREQAGLTRFGDVRLLSSEKTGEGRWRVRLETPATGDMHEVDVAAERGELTYLTCSSATLKHPRRFVTTGYRLSAKEGG